MNTGSPVLRSCRQVEGLHWVFPRAKAPGFATGKRPRGAKGAGLRFEKLVATAIPQATHGQWFEFCDKNGLGFACPDLIIPTRDVVFVLECKLTANEEADRQLSDLYLPLARQHFGKLPAGIVVARHLTAQTNPHRVVGTLREALQLAPGGILPILHWLGKGKI